MLHPVWPSVYFWYFLGLCSSLLWLIPSMEMEFIKKSTPLAGVFVRFTILFSWFGGNTVLSIIFLKLIENPRTDHLFRGYECVGRTIGYALVLFGNIGLYYYSEKSIVCMLTFLFLGFFCLCTLFYIQPFTDFGVLDFFLSASLTQALSLFGLHIYTWLVFIAVIVLVGLRNKLELVLLQQPRGEVESSRMVNADSEGEARNMQPRREVELERIRSIDSGLRMSGRMANTDSEGEARDMQPRREVELERIISIDSGLRMSGRIANADSEGEARDMQPRREVELERIRSIDPDLRMQKKSGHDLELGMTTLSGLPPRRIRLQRRVNLS